MFLTLGDDLAYLSHSKSPCLENIVLPIVCLVVIIACFIFKFNLCSNVPTLYDDIITWPCEFFRKIMISFILFVFSITVTAYSVIIFSKFQADTIAQMKEENPRHYILWNYIFLEIILKGIEQFQCSNRRLVKVILYLIWCALFAPSICLFEPNMAYAALQETLLVLCALNTVTFLWSVEHLKCLRRNLVTVLSVIYISLTITSILMIAFGYPKNIFGLILVFLVLHAGFLFHALLFIISTLVFIEFSKLGIGDAISNCIDLYICTMHMFARIMLFDTYTFTVWLWL